MLICCLPAEDAATLTRPPSPTPEHALTRPYTPAPRTRPPWMADPPAPSSREFTVEEDATLTASLLPPAGATDLAGGTFTSALLVPSGANTHGTLLASGPLGFAYTPEPGFVGTASFAYQLRVTSNSQAGGGLSSGNPADMLTPAAQVTITGV
jgi:hypothetical protein